MMRIKIDTKLIPSCMWQAVKWLILLFIGMAIVWVAGTWSLINIYHDGTILGYSIVVLVYILLCYIAYIRKSKKK